MHSRKIWVVLLIAVFIFGTNGIPSAQSGSKPDQEPPGPPSEEDVIPVGNLTMDNYTFLRDKNESIPLDPPGNRSSSFGLGPVMMRGQIIRNNWVLSYTTTPDDGILIFSAYFRNKLIIFDLTYPWFKVGLMTHELEWNYKIWGPHVSYYQSSFKIQARYDIPSGGYTYVIVETFAFYDTGEFDPWIYYDIQTPIPVEKTFPLRIDFDLGGIGASNLFNYFDYRYWWAWWGEWWTCLRECKVKDQKPRINGIKSRVSSNGDPEAKPLANMKPDHSDNAWLYGVAYHSGETEDDPNNYVDGEQIAVDTGYLGIWGSDIVYWYKATLGTAYNGLSGPWIWVNV